MALAPAARPAPKKKAKPMGMRSTAPRMQGPISGGAGGGFAQQPGPGMSGGAPPAWAPPSRGPMPLPPSAAPRPGMPGMGRPSFGGGGIVPPMMPGGGNFARPQPPAGGPGMMPPPMMDGGFGVPRGIPGGEMDDMGMGGGMNDIAQRMQVQRAAGVFDKPQMPGPDPRAAAMDRMQQMRGAMPQKPMMNSIGAPPMANSPAPGGMPQGRQMPDMGRLQQLLASARGSQPQF